MMDRGLSNARLRPATAADAPALSALGRDTFIATFGHRYAPEDLEDFLVRVHGEQAVARDIADPEMAIRLLDADGGLYGYVKLGPRSVPALDADLADRRVLEVRQLYLRPPAFGSGWADRMLGWALEEARRRGADTVLLSVFCENHRAQAFYRRHGFQHRGSYDFRVGRHVDLDYVWRLDLDAQPTTA